MASRRQQDEYDEDDGPELEDPEAPDPADYDDDDEPDVVPCPYCRKAISEDAVQCHHCGQYMSAEDRPINTSLIVVIIILVLVALAVLGLVIGR